MLPSYNEDLAIDYKAFYGLAAFASLMALIALVAPPVLIMPFLGKVVAAVALISAACAAGVGVRVHLNAIAFEHEEMMRQAEEFVGQLRWIKASSDSQELKEGLRHYALQCTTQQLVSCKKALEE